MKKLNYLLSIVVLLAVLVTVGCGKDDGGPTAEQQVIDKFSKTWTLSSATFGSEGSVTDLDGLTLTIGDMSYSTGGTVARSPHPWPVNGTWAFKTPITDAASSFVVTRGDGLDITVTLTETTMSLTFTFDKLIHQGGRDEGIDGVWSMEFSG